MKKIFIVWFIGIVCIGVSEGPAQTRSQNEKDARLLEDHAAGFKIEYVGQLTQNLPGACTVKLPSASGNYFPAAYLHVFADSLPFVYLPGTFGGKYYYGDNTSDKMLANRIPGDSVSVGNLNFARDYWTVYAGQGQWETVINCRLYHDGKYYVVSFERDSKIGRPGEIVNGIRLTKTQLRARLVDKLQDSTDAQIDEFNRALQSFSFTR